MQRLPPQLKPTPIRGRHPLVYGASLLLLVSLFAFLLQIGMFWILATSSVAILMAIGAIVITVRDSRPR